jgi:hypothetical protein
VRHLADPGAADAGDEDLRAALVAVPDVGEPGSVGRGRVLRFRAPALGRLAERSDDGFGQRRPHAGVQVDHVVTLRHAGMGLRTPLHYLHVFAGAPLPEPDRLFGDREVSAPVDVHHLEVLRIVLGNPIPEGLHICDENFLISQFSDTETISPSRTVRSQ